MAAPFGAGRPAAARLADLAERFLGCTLPIRVRAWDGSEAGAPPTSGTPVAVLRSRRALRDLLWQPGELGLARAYVRGDLDVEGDLLDGLRRVWTARARAEGSRPSRTLPALVLAAGTLAGLGAVGLRPRPPGAESRLRGRRHTRARDRAAISHHYDLSNAFYELILDPTLAYSCAFWTSDAPSYRLVDAQRDKLDLICGKLDLAPGDHLLDIGCGWGSLTLHAAQEYGVRVTAVTLSIEQRRLVEQRAKEAGVDALVDVRLQHFADLDARGADAVASVEMGEHVGDAEYAGFAAAVHGWLRPGGRALVQQMSRGSGASGHDAHPGGGAFIETYVAPDMHMRPLARTIQLFADAGLETRDVQAMREHYPRTVAAWARTLEERWDDAVAMVGEEQARVWRLYLAGGSLAFEQNRMGVDQILLVRPTPEGDSRMPATPLAWLGPHGDAREPRR
jgi:cyclopropane-fatty-acyl-phospholipid synthase